MGFDYRIEETDDVITPALIYYTDLLEQNIKKIIETAGGAENLWPHIKSHKTAELIQMMQSYGIERCKCATIAEAELAAVCGGKHVCVAYPLVGPNIRRFLDLVGAYSKTVFWAVGDDETSLRRLGCAAAVRGIEVNVLIDVDMGMHRTGVSKERVPVFWETCNNVAGIRLRGLHCYDGNRHEQDAGKRLMLAEMDNRWIDEVRGELIGQGYECNTVIVGGSPSFPCHCTLRQVYYSPGTIFIHDFGYLREFPDLQFTPAAAIMTRVISNPEPGIFTLDLGYKAIAADPPFTRGKIINMGHLQELFQNEEHWTFRMEKGYEGKCPVPGTVLYVIPTHICPTSALYPSVLTASGGRITGQWMVAARNRKMTY